MTRIDPRLGTAPVARIAGPHQSTVATILRAVELGLFTAAQADMMIDRVRAHLTVLPIKSPPKSPSTEPISAPISAPVASLSSAADGFPVAVSGLASETLPNSPDRTFSVSVTVATTDPAGHPDAHHEGMRP